MINLYEVSFCVFALIVSLLVMDDKYSFITKLMHHKINAFVSENKQTKKDKNTLHHIYRKRAKG